jgi:hypothetical protein
LEFGPEPDDERRETEPWEEGIAMYLGKELRFLGRNPGN